MSTLAPYDPAMTTSARSRQRRQAIAIALAAVAFALALIGIARSATAAGESARASRTVTVEVVDFAYRPPNLTIGRGSRVVFSNASGMTHTATRRGSFTTGRIKAGKSAAISFPQRGTFRYHCTIHPFMKGRVVVE
jgi:plastocyanin